MKTLENRMGIRVFVISVLCMMSQLVNAQNPAEGHWEGLFMDDFKTIVKLEPDGQGSFTGSIQMFDGMGEIQNDKLSKIIIKDKKLSFYIDAKETGFEGTLQEEKTRLSGSFIFPDQSRHPIQLQKVKPGESLDSGSDWM